MADDQRPYSVTVPIQPARPDTPAERAQRAQDNERAEYHSAPRTEFDTINERRTSWLMSSTLTMEYRDGRGNVATTSFEETSRDSSASLMCRDGRRLPENVASSAIAAARGGNPDAGWFSTDYTFGNGNLNPLENACRADHNNRRHGGREPGM